MEEINQDPSIDDALLGGATATETNNEPGLDQAPEEPSLETPSDDDELGLFDLSTTEDDGAEDLAPEDPTEASDFTLPDDWNLPEGTISAFRQSAQTLGLDNKAAAAYLTEAWGEITRANTERLKEDNAALKAEWGVKYKPTVIATKKFVQRLAADNNLSAEDLAVLASPKGIRLMNTIRQSVAEPSSIVRNEPKTQSREEQAEALLADPDTFLALKDSTHPDHASVNARYNKLLGLG